MGRGGNRHAARVRTAVPPDTGASQNVMPAADAAAPTCAAASRRVSPARSLWRRHYCCCCWHSGLTIGEVVPYHARHSGACEGSGESARAYNRRAVARTCWAALGSMVLRTGGAIQPKEGSRNETTNLQSIRSEPLEVLEMIPSFPK